jgi:hypothetical protein
MAVVRCGHCSRWYWRYPGDHIPAGYCQLACWEARRHKYAPLFSAPYYRAKLLAHMAEVHGTSDVNDWFNCPGCERIELEYQRSLTA